MFQTVLEGCKVFAVVVLLAGILVYSFMLIQAFILKNESVKRDLNTNPATNYGIPFSAMAAFGVVSLLEFSASDKSLKFKAFGLDFEGPAAPVTLWVVCFAAFIWAMKTVSPSK
jgi:hypothetical protein